MNLKTLFSMQKFLDDHIMEEHPELQGQNNLDWKILALLVELGECANEWRGFKKWSKDQKPRIIVEYAVCSRCEGLGFITDDDGLLKDCDVSNCLDGELTKNPLLEEYVDCLHFILSIGLELGIIISEIDFISEQNKSITRLFADLMLGIATLNFPEADKKNNYISNFRGFLQLGEMFGFTWEQIEQAYFAKNAVNHQRQENGY